MSMGSCAEVIKKLKFKKRHLSDLLRDFKTMSLVRKPKKYLKRRTIFELQVASL